MADAMGLEKLVEGIGNEFTTVVAADVRNSVTLCAVSILCHGFVGLEVTEDFVFGLHCLHPGVTAKVIHDEEKVPGSVVRFRAEGSAYVHVYQLKWTRCSICSR